MKDSIKFGTDGWRGVIGDDFTFANVRRAASAVAAYVRAKKMAERGLVVGYDTRFLSSEFARAASEVIAAAGIPVVLADQPTPTPAVSFAVVERQAAGAVVIAPGGGRCGHHREPQSGALERVQVQSALRRLCVPCHHSRN